MGTDGNSLLSPGFATWCHHPNVACFDTEAREYKMSVWLSESEYRQSGAATTGLTINVAFLQEIKEDVQLQDLIQHTRQHFLTAESSTRNRPIETARVLNRLRDELETYFALEEFYGYFQNAEVVNPSVSHQADQLKGEHETLFLDLSELIDAV